MAESYQVLSTPTFEDAFRELTKAVRQRVRKKIQWLSQHPEVLVETLRHLPKEFAGLRKYRIGDYRLLLWVDHPQRVLTLHTIRHRSLVYKKI